MIQCWLGNCISTKFLLDHDPVEWEPAVLASAWQRLCPSVELSSRSVWRLDQTATSTCFVGRTGSNPHEQLWLSSSKRRTNSNRQRSKSIYRKIQPAVHEAGTLAMRSWHCSNLTQAPHSSSQHHILLCCQSRWCPWCTASCSWPAVGDHQEVVRSSHSADSRGIQFWSCGPRPPECIDSLRHLLRSLCVSTSKFSMPPSWVDQHVLLGVVDRRQRSSVL